MTHSERTAEFVQLFAKSQRRLYAFIRSQVKSPADADDILGQTSAVLWEKFDSFEPDSNFVAWACRIARLEVLSLHRNQQRTPTVFSDSLSEQLADEMVRATDEVDHRHDALLHCMDGLSEKDRSLIDARYQDEASVKAMAIEMSRTESAVYKSLNRVHDALLRCIEKQLSKEERR